MKFNVASVAFEDKAGCGGVLRDDKGVACILFFGSIVTRGSKMTEIIAIKTASELFIGLGWHVKVPLVTEFNLCVALEWLLKRNYRPTLWNLFIDIDCGINQLVRVQFLVFHWQSNDMANALAKAGITRPLLFKA
ncbi:hypothetical protein CXB51_033783 [Gossypium anomalum]|uniref:RNase H type-1 domain-containing protein n=1 Tax=Gossypium anomalum TaxID=47600 RepID=A0A8J5XQ18_9ROSI|nr:hypothetical protein CXB51_033783 [Gossypium anomalum]